MFRKVLARLRSQDTSKPPLTSGLLEPKAIESWSDQLRGDLETLRQNSADLREKYKDVPLRARSAAAKKASNSKPAKKAKLTSSAQPKQAKEQEKSKSKRSPTAKKQARD